MRYYKDIRLIILIGLVVLAGISFLPNNGLAATCKNILIYVFPGVVPNYNTGFDDEIITILTNAGYNPTTTVRSATGELTSTLLSKYDQIWIIDAGSNALPPTTTEINNLLNYYNNGGRILLTGEEGSSAYYDDVDLISQKFDTTMGYGDTKADQGCSTVVTTTSTHSTSILNRVSTITTSGGVSNVFVSTTNPNVESVATSKRGIDFVYVLDETGSGKGRILFHPSFFTFLDKDGASTLNIEKCDSKQYTLNVANWLCGSAPPLPPPPPPCTWYNDSCGRGSCPSTKMHQICSGPPGCSRGCTPGATQCVPDPACTATGAQVPVPGNACLCGGESVGGLVPCGRKTDDPTTDICECCPCTICHFFVLGKRVIDFIFKFVVSPLFLLMIVISGAKFVGSAGGPEKNEEAKRILLAAVIGFLVVLLTWMTINVFLSFLVKGRLVGPSDVVKILGQPWDSVNCNPGKTCIIATCGNGIVDPGEECDGANLNGKTCSDFGFTSGTLRCDSDCKFDFTLCGHCGDGIVQPPEEECEPGVSFSTTCADLVGLDEGTLQCNSNCKFDTSLCWECGNEIWEAAEECEGSISQSDYVSSTRAQDYNEDGNIDGTDWAMMKALCSSDCKIVCTSTDPNFPNLGLGCYNPEGTDPCQKGKYVCDTNPAHSTTYGKIVCYNVYNDPTYPEYIGQDLFDYCCDDHDPTTDPVPPAAIMAKVIKVSSGEGKKCDKVCRGEGGICVGIGQYADMNCKMVTCHTGTDVCDDVGDSPPACNLWGGGGHADEVPAVGMCKDTMGSIGSCRDGSQASKDGDPTNDPSCAYEIFVGGSVCYCYVPSE